MKAQKYIITVLGVLLTGSILGQLDKSYILEYTDVPELQRIASDEGKRYQSEYDTALVRANQEGWPTLNLVRLNNEGGPVYETPTNNASATLTHTSIARTVLGVTGTGMTIGMWEATEGATGSFRPRHTHQDFGSRITQQNGGNGFSSHATHVAGTLIGQPPGGISINSRGMATHANLDAYSSGFDLSEMATAAANGLLVSNHSYGLIGGYHYETTLNTGFPSFHNYDRWAWYGGTSQFVANGDDPKFGAYSSDSRGVDNVCFNAPYYLPVFAAGNDHNDNPIQHVLGDDQVRNITSGTYFDFNPSSHPLGDGFQSCNISAEQCGTNVLTVGNMTKSLGINASSSRGATNDGRIKPDICGIGTNVYSAEQLSNTDYGTKTGTSMSSPNVAGSLLLLQDAYENYHGSSKFMRSATLKALAIHTATDYGNPGPDYTYGWGLLNTQLAGIAVQQDAWFGGGSSSYVIVEALLNSPTDIYEYTFNSDGTDPIKVTLAYTDPVLSGSAIALQNDLDLLVVDHSPVQTYAPYVLDPNNPNNNAMTGDNDRDNVEQVYLSPVTAQSGLYTVNVSLESASLFNGVPQNFSLIISGIHPTCHYNIHHRVVDLPSDTYSAQNDIVSEVDIEPGRIVNYQYGGKVVLKPGFHAKQNSFFATNSTPCN